jgi:phosphoesterase RecJ-like protein
MGNIIDLKRQAGLVINIDHHVHHSHYGNINLINPKASSNSEQLYYLFRKAGLPLTPQEAAGLYVGLVTDTGRFQQENTTPESHFVAAKLVEAGAPVADINRRLYATFPVSTLKLLGRALESLSLGLGGRVAVLTLTLNDLKESRAKREETENMINYGLTVPSVEVAALLRQEGNNQIKASLRGKGRVDLCRLAVSYGGGGHRNASGYTVSGDIRGAVRDLLMKLKRVL